MAIFLSVLKIIGIVLLVILALIIVLLLLVLFVPIRYRLDANVPRTDPDEGFDVNTIMAKASFSWLLHILSGGISFPEDKQFTVKVFGIKVFPGKKKNDAKNKKAEEKNEDDAGKSQEKEETSEKPASGVIEMSDMGDDKTDNSSEDSSCDGGKSEDAMESSTSSADINSEETGKEKSFLDILWDIIDLFINIIETPQNVFSKIQYTISRVCGKIGMIKTTIENDIFKRAFELVKKKLIKIIRMILPDKTDIALVLGLGDPAATAELMGVYGALYPALYNKVRFQPDFENKVVQAEVHLKGHITIFTIVWAAAVCFFNKDVKKVIRRFKKIINS